MWNEIRNVRLTDESVHVRRYLVQVPHVIPVAQGHRYEFVTSLHGPSKLRIIGLAALITALAELRYRAAPFLSIPFAEGVGCISFSGTGIASRIKSVLIVFPFIKVAVGLAARVLLRLLAFSFARC